MLLNLLSLLPMIGLLFVLICNRKEKKKTILHASLALALASRSQAMCHRVMGQLVEWVSWVTWVTGQLVEWVSWVTWVTAQCTFILDSCMPIPSHSSTAKAIITPLLPIHFYDHRHWNTYHGFRTMVLARVVRILRQKN